MIREFREFALKGNLIELAVAFILALAFSTVISAFITGIVMQIIAALVGQPNFDSLSFDLSGTPIFYGTFLTALFNFLLIALVLFMVVKAANRMKRPEDSRDCPFCAHAVSEAATRCPACTSELPAAPVAPAAV